MARAPRTNRNRLTALFSTYRRDRPRIGPVTLKLESLTIRFAPQTAPAPGCITAGPPASTVAVKPGSPLQEAIGVSCLFEAANFQKMQVAGHVAGQDRLAGGGDCAAKDPSVGCEHGFALPVGEIPDAQRVVAAAGHQVPVHVD